MHHHLGVRLRRERIALLAELLLDDGGVLDDPVMDQGDVAVLRRVGMGVGLVGSAVGGPACVGDADGTGR